MSNDLGKPTQTLVPCWMPKPLPPRHQCTGWFALAMSNVMNVGDLFEFSKFLIVAQGKIFMSHMVTPGEHSPIFVSLRAIK